MFFVLSFTAKLMKGTETQFKRYIDRKKQTNLGTTAQKITNGSGWGRAGSTERGSGEKGLCSEEKVTADISGMFNDLIIFLVCAGYR
uniref:Expressed protein n=1 Tax=Echinococcus granulosus TaxID=6210 RepID=A0A068X050_ECHGR|nr:expressed protein [Echinococcus granulosus]